MEVNGQFFFLPFFTTVRTAVEASTIATGLADAVFEYKRKHDIHLPTWLRNITFNAERALASQIEELEEKLLALKEQQAKWNRYKALLCTSGKKLAEIVVDILRDFFQLTLSSEEKFVEDALILREDGSPHMVVEIKGVNGGLKREHVNQVDSHRERLGFGPEVLGLLLINDFMDLEGLEPRMEKNFDANHLAHATAINVRILRATSLFALMTALEGVEDRKERFLSLCASASPLVEAKRDEE